MVSRAKICWKKEIVGRTRLVTSSSASAHPLCEKRGVNALFISHRGSECVSYFIYINLNLMRNEVGGRVVESNTKCANKTGSRGSCSVVGDSSLHSVEFYFVVCRRSVGRLFALIKSGYNLIQH